MNKLEQLIKELCPNGVKYVAIKDYFTRLKGTPITAGKMKEIESPDGEIRIFAGGKTVINAHEKDIPNANITRVPAVLVQSRGVIDFIYYEKPFTFKNEMWAYTAENKITVKYLYYFLQNNTQHFRDSASGMGSLPQISLHVTEDFKIPVPPLEVQAEIVKILDEYSTSVTALQQELEKELTARKKQYEYYRDLLLGFGVHGGGTSECEWRTMGSLFKIEMCRRVKKEETTPHGEIPFYQNGTLGKEAKLFLTRETYEKYKAISKMPQKGSVMLSTAGTLGRAFEYNGEEAYYQDSNIIWLNNDESVITNAFLLTYCRSFPWKVPTRGTLKHLHNYMIEDTLIPIPPIEKQKRIVSILDRFDKLCNDISEGLPAEIEARRKQYEYYRDKLLSFEEVKL